MNFIDKFSPNFNKRKRNNKSIKFIVIHYTGMQSERESIKKLCHPSSGVSCHYLINLSGKIFRLVNEKNISWHAGKSKWQKYKNLNSNSLGIELVNKGHRWGYNNFKKKQIRNLIKLCNYLKKKYKIKKQNILGHSDIAPLRKSDPGEKFPWCILAKKQLGIWHDLKLNVLQKMRKVKIDKQKHKRIFINNIRKIGYFVKPSIEKKQFRKIIKAFQRHFRSEMVNGILDLECLKISINLGKKASKKA